MRFRGSDIQSFMPSVDSRANDQVRVIAGRNFEVDVKGPKAGYGNHILTPFPFYAPRGVQGIRVRGRTLVITQDAILEWRDITPFNWELLYAFEVYLPDPLALPWFAFYMQDDIYVGHPSRGLYGAALQEGTKKLELSFLTENQIPGLPEEVYGAAIVRNRVILVTRNYAYWSATGDFSDLTPSAGGAGFQNINDFISGDFLSIAGFNDGFIIWTTEGGLLAEYIGGDLVWRWSPFTSRERPNGPWSTTQLSNGATVFLSDRGLKVTANGQVPQDWTPEFNEFFREYAANTTRLLDHWRIMYDMQSERLALMESLNGSDYWRTFVLHPTIDKWGVFSETHYGVLPFTNTQIGFVDMQGIPRVLDGGIYWDQTPPNELGYSRVMPRIQKGIYPPSSTAVSRVRPNNLGRPVSIAAFNDFSSDEVIRPGWIDGYSSALQSYAKSGLKSEIELGYFRPAEMNQSADGNIEIHEVVISTLPSSPEEVDWRVMGHEDKWDWEIDDWHSPHVILRFDFVVDLFDFEGQHDLNQLGGPPLDLNEISYPVVLWPAGVVNEDWNLPGEPEDWHGPTLNLPRYTMEMELRYSMDGRDEFVTVPELARFDSIARHFTAMTHGNLHRLKIKATNPLDFFHVTYLELTEAYGGEWI